ncbi:MAG: cardiolipin synthase [Cyanobacteria bacterium J083]|nr:MAG: cardiolipin synthase [Cyanobacteria bacterium J083]
MLSGINLVSIYSVITLLVHSIGVVTAAHAVMKVRSSRGAIAWGISLITFPWLAIPLYLILGRNSFFEYAQALQVAYIEHYQLISQAYSTILQFKAVLPKQFATLVKLSEVLTPLPWTTGNEVELFIEGEKAYQTMLETIKTAKDYILLQSYIINNDYIGNKFKQALIDKAKEGVSIRLLYDKIGSRQLPRHYLKSLTKHGIKVSGFGTTKRRKGSRFKINFRNHRKILIVDGKVGFMGGLNIGDEYLGKDPRFGYWRDTHLQIKGAAVQCLQSVFLGDWYWVTKEIPPVSWQVAKSRQKNQTVLIFPTGPADKLENCNLFYLSLIERAQTRLWIASPYFVPNYSILNALKLAALRGVDVRIILPNRPDHLTVYLCSFSYYTELQAVNIKLYRYQSGFMHQKVILVDDAIAGVGTVNLDNRSFFLNFEVMSFLLEQQFIERIATMLKADFNNSCLVDLKSYQAKPLWFKLAARIARLLAPIL